MKGRVVFGALVAAVAIVMLGTPVRAAGERYVTWGADLAPEQQQELIQLFGIDQSVKAQTVTTAEMVQTLQGTGLPVAPTDKSISSSLLTCLNRGDGLDVRTQNITRITAPMYANAMVTAGVGDANVLIAAPPSSPVTGETALAGVFKAFPQCQAGKQPEQSRINLAYEQIARTIALAGSNGDLTKASAAMLDAAQPAITGQAKDDNAIGGALDNAARAQGLQLDPARRTETIGFLKKLGGLDYGTYAKGYQVQQVSQNEVRVVPAGPGAPGAAAAGGFFSGDVQRNEANTLTVNSNGQQRQVGASPNVIITRDGKSAAMSDIQPGDNVSVTTNPDGSSQRIDATSAGGAAPWKWLIPLLLALGLLGLLGWLLSRRRDSFILEPNTETEREQRHEHAGMRRP